VQKTKDADDESLIRISDRMDNYALDYVLQ